MRLRTVCWMLMIAFAPQQGWAGGDVGYQLDTKSLDVADEQAVVSQTAIELKDRAWAAPGVEESDSPNLEESFNRCRVRRICLEREGVSDGPSWLDDVAWPRTRQMFHPSCEDCQIFCFGGIALQR